MNNDFDTLLTPNEKDYIGTNFNLITKENVFIILSLGILIFIVYTNTLDNDWVWDDVSSVLIHKHVQDPEYFFQLFKEDQHVFGRGQGNFYRPLVSVSFMMDFLLSYRPEYGKNELGTPNVSPLLFHITNIVLHWIVVSLLFLLLQKFGVPRSIAICTSLIYSIHPIHTEAVTYISGRADMMSAMFILLSLLFALKYLESEKFLSIYIFLTLLAFICGLLSKEASTIFPVLLVVILLFFKTESTTNSKKIHVKKILLTVSSLIIFVAYLVLRSTILKFSSDTQNITKTWSEKIIEVGQALAFYLRVMIIPINLHMEQSLENTPWWTSTVGYTFLTTLILGLIWAINKKHYRISMGIGWFVVGWFPISGIFTLNAPQAEHWMYLPIIGFWWTIFEILNIFLSKLSDKKIFTPIPLPKLVFILALILCIPYSYQTILRNNDWQNNETIFKNTLLHNPNSARVRYNLAVTYEDITKDYPSAAKQYMELLKYYKSLKNKTNIDNKKLAFLGEEEIEATLSLGKCLYLSGRYSEAINVLLPLTYLTTKKEFLPYAIEAVSIISKSSIPIGDIKSFQIISTLLASLDKEKKEEILWYILGGTLETPSYVSVN